MRVLDPDEYSSVWEGMWWALQTVTTVGYGDVTPSNAPGRIVATLVMLEGIAFLTIIVAAISSAFVNRAHLEREGAAAEAEAADGRVEERLDRIERRLDRIEALVRSAAER